MLKILTLTWNGLDKLQKLRPGLMRNLKILNQPFVWRIRSNGCTDGTVEEVKGWESVELMKMDHNRSNFSQGMNSLATDINEEDVVMLLNNDIAFTKDDDLLKMWNLLGKKDVGIVGARTVFTGTNLIQHNGVAFSKTRYGSMPWHIGAGEKIRDEEYPNRSLQAVTAAIQMIEGKLWRDNKGLDEGFYWAFEDVDFCLRAKQSKWTVACCGDTLIQHEESATLKKNHVNKLFMDKNVRHFKEKWWKNNVPQYRLDYEDIEKRLSYTLLDPPLESA